MMTKENIIEKMALIIIDLEQRVTELERKQEQTKCFLTGTVAPALNLTEDDGK